MTIEIVPAEAEKLLSWQGLTEAFVAGHALPRAEIGDLFLYRGADTLLDRAAWIDGLGALVKVANVVPGNAARGLPTIHGAVNLFDDVTGDLRALVDFQLVTKWKTAGDSLLAASRLARPESRNFLIVGAGAVARSMIDAYRSLWPDAQFTVWARKREAAAEMGVGVAEDLEAAVRAADVICSATMATSPVIRGEWLQPGQHLDLIGAYRPDMREVDDTAMARATVFVDSRATTIHHIGEIMAPIASRAITESDIRADFYDIKAGLYRRDSADQITIAKNGGGAHLDLMTADYIRRAWANR